MTTVLGDPYRFMVRCAPEIVLDAVDLHEDLIQVPLPLSMLAHVGGAFRPDLPGEDWTKSIDPEPHTFMADIDPALMQKVFDIAEGKWKPNIHHHRELDDLR